MKFKTLPTLSDANDKKPSLKLFLPATTNGATSLRAAETGETLLVIILRALNDYGFHMPEDALVDRRSPR